MKVVWLKDEPGAVPEVCCESGPGPEGGSEPKVEMAGGVFGLGRGLLTGDSARKGLVDVGSVRCCGAGAAHQLDMVRQDAGLTSMDRPRQPQVIPNNEAAAAP